MGFDLLKIEGISGFTGNDVRGHGASARGIVELHAIPFECWLNSIIATVIGQCPDDSRTGVYIGAFRLPWRQTRVKGRQSSCFAQGGGLRSSILEPKEATMGSWLSEREQRLVAGAETASAATPIPTQMYRTASIFRLRRARRKNASSGASSSWPTTTASGLAIV